MSNILITGAGSFIGTNFRKYSENKKVTEVSLTELTPDKIDFTGYDVVLHLAAIVHQTKKISEQEYSYVNTDLCLSVAENARKSGVKQFVFLSTVRVYGATEKSGIPKSETSECFPDDSYGRSKYAAENALMKIADQQFTVSIVRTPLVYGEGVKANMLSLIRLVDSFPLLPFGKIENRRSFTYVENLVAFIDRLIEKRAAGIFLAKDDNTLSTTELVESISRHLGKKVYLFKLPRIVSVIFSYFMPGKLERLYGSSEFENNITKNALNFSPPFSTDEGIKKMVESYKIKKFSNN